MTANNTWRQSDGKMDSRAQSVDTTNTGLIRETGSYAQIVEVMYLCEPEQ
jgi:hypothetical protein